MLEFINNMKPQVDPSQYYTSEYNSKGRFCSYWHQIQEIILVNPKNMLEIGVGNNFISSYFKERKLYVTTLDIDKRLNPDIVGSVLEMPFSKKSFDAVACYEVLEHLPFEDFIKALSEISRVSQRYVFISLPEVNRVCHFNIQIPKIGEIKKLIPLPTFKKEINKFDGEHYWEIGKAGFPLSKIVSNIEKVGFKIEKTYRVFEMPYHRIFVLKV